MIDPPSLPFPAWKPDASRMPIRGGLPKYTLAVKLARPSCDLDNQTACQTDETSKPLISYGLAAHGLDRREQ
jgi:hypothetical protein